MEKTDDKKRSIDFMGDFVSLFMSLYTLDFDSENDDVFISKNFKQIMSCVLYYSSISNIKFDGKYLYNEESMISIDEFINYLKTTSVKKYWQDKYKYDFDKDCIVVEIKKSDAKKEVEKYDTSVIETMTLLLNYYKYIESQSINNEHIDQAAFEKQQEFNKKYEYINKENI